MRKRSHFIKDTTTIFHTKPKSVISWSGRWLSDHLHFIGKMAQACQPKCDPATYMVGGETWLLTDFYISAVVYHQPHDTKINQCNQKQNKALDLQVWKPEFILIPRIYENAKCAWHWSHNSSRRIQNWGPQSSDSGKLWVWGRGPPSIKSKRNWGWFYALTAGLSVCPHPLTYNKMQTYVHTTHIK